MKTFLFLSAFIVGMSAQAFETIACKGNERFGTTEKLQLTLTAVGQTVNDVDEGVRVPYHFVLTNDGALWATGKVSASQEDVMFMFRGNSKKYGKISGTIFMDELDQTSLTLNGQKFNFDCGSDEE